MASCLPTTDRDVRVGREDRRALYSGCLSWSPCIGAARLDVRHPGACSLDGSIECRTGHTQIGRVLVHARGEHKRQKVSALVFVGDAVEETPANLYAAARELGTPCFLFQEGDDPNAAKVFREIARITKGASPLDPGAADQLRDLLRVVAMYATGGLQALSASRNAGAVGCRSNSSDTLPFAGHLQSAVTVASNDSWREERPFRSSLMR